MITELWNGRGWRNLWVHLAHPCPSRNTQSITMMLTQPLLHRSHSPHTSLLGPNQERDFGTSEPAENVW